jgi:hypothetical protein
MAYGKSEPKPKMGPREAELRAMRERRADAATKVSGKVKAKSVKTLKKVIKNKGSGRGR